MKIKRLQEQDIRTLQGKQVIIFGTNNISIELYGIFKFYSIKVLGYALLNKPSKMMIIKNKCKGLTYFEFSKLQKISRQYSNVIIQSLGYDGGEKEIIKEIAATVNCEVSHLDYGAILNSFSHLVAFDALKNPIKLHYKMMRWEQSCFSRNTVFWRNFKRSNSKNVVLVCSPPKTADFTVNYTIDYVNSLFGNDLDTKKINYINLSHQSRMIDKKECEKKFGTLKIITGIREPISQNFSRMFQDISSGIGINNWVLGDLAVLKYGERRKKLKEYEALFSESGDDVQKLWESYIERYIYNEHNVHKLTNQAKTVQGFIGEFKDYVVDILVYPFDKAQGYTIIKEGNTEIFVYQLEKLNAIVPQLSEWMGIPFAELVNGNIGEDSWTGDTYKQALKEIELTQEYFDRCYDEPYVKHFYSETDIEKFKERWRPHIRNN